MDVKKRFNTVEEVTSWKNFELEGQIYDLSHLNAHEVEYTELKKDGTAVIYKYIVTYSFHCFAKEDKNQPAEEQNKLMYFAPRDKRPFNFRRYHLSFQLRKIIETLDKQFCFHGEGNYKGKASYAVCKLTELDGREHDYRINFVSFKENRKLRLHITTAYPLDNSLGRVKKIGFLTIAYKTLKS
jgi:hypothetical protein